MLVAVCLALAVPTQGQAQGDLTTEIAKKHYELGVKLYQASAYTKALVEFKKAYALEGVSGLLFNIARCYEVLADLEQAVKHYRLYLEKRPDASNRDLVEVRLKTLNARLRAQQLKREQAAAASSSQPASQEAAVTDAPAPEPEQPQEPADKPAGSWKATAGWATLGVGAASLVTGVVFGVLAKSKSDEHADGVTQGQDFVVLDGIDADGKRFQTIQVVTLIIGGVAAAAGGGCYCGTTWEAPTARSVRPWRLSSATRSWASAPWGGSSHARATRRADVSHSGPAAAAAGRLLQRGLPGDLQLQKRSGLPCGAGVPERHVRAAGDHAGQQRRPGLA